MKIEFHCPTSSWLVPFIKIIPFLQCETILMSLTHVVMDTMIICLACAAASGYDGVHGLCCGRVSCLCLWSVLPPETILNPGANADASRHHVDVLGQCYHQKPHGSPCAPNVCKRPGTYFCSGIDDFRFTVGKEEHIRFLWQPLSLPPSTHKIK